MHERRVSAQRIAESHLLFSARAAGRQQVQVRCAMLVDHLNQEATPRPGVEVGRDEVPAGSGQDLCYGVRTVKINDGGLHVDDRLGHQAWHSSRSNVLGWGNQPAGEHCIQLPAQLRPATLPLLVGRLNMHLLRRPRRPLAHEHIVPFTDPLAGSNGDLSSQGRKRTGPLVGAGLDSLVCK